jgi:hypothetical protein
VNLLRFRLFSFDILTIEWGTGLDQPCGITGGSAHDFERLDEVFDDEEERLGFQPPHLLKET